MAIDSKNLLVWVKAMSRGQALPLDASEIYDSLAAAEAYTSSAIAYPGQTIKAMLDDGKYHTYTLQPSDAGFVLEEVGAVDESDLKQYVMVVNELPTSGQAEGTLYIHNTDGYIWTNSAWKKVFWDLTADLDAAKVRIKAVEDELPNKAPIANPVFTGTVKVGADEVAMKSYVDGLISNLESRTPIVLNNSTFNDLANTEAGTTYRVAEAGEYFNHKCEVGDLILVLEDIENAGSAGVSNSVMVIQANISGAVTSAAETSTVGEIVVFDAVTGKVIRGSGVQIESLNDAIAKSHEHTNKAILDTYDKTQAELLASAKTEAQSLVDALSSAVDGKLDNKADKATTLAGYGIADAYNKTEIDATIKTITDNLNTKAASADVNKKIADTKAETLEEAAAAAAEALEVRVGAIPADTNIKAYVDTAVGNGGVESANAIAIAKQEAIETSQTYTNTQIAEKMAVIEF